MRQLYIHRRRRYDSLTLTLTHMAAIIIVIISSIISIAFPFLFSVPVASAASAATAAAAAAASPASATITIHAWPLHEASPTPLATVKYEASTGNATLLSYKPPKVSSSSSSWLKWKQDGGQKGSVAELQKEAATRELDLVRVGLYDGVPLEKGGRWTGVVLGRMGLAGAVDDGSEESRQRQRQRQQQGWGKGKEKGDEEMKTTLVLNVDADGVVYGVGVGAEWVKKRRPAKAAAGRAKGKDKDMDKNGDGSDAGPYVVVDVSRQTMGPTPHLNKPIVLNAEGKREGEEPEKTFLQK